MLTFGSRARGDEKPYSDYDILIVAPEKEHGLIDTLYDATMEVLYETQRLVSLKIYRRADFERLAAIPTPFMRNVFRDGVPLGEEDARGNSGADREGKGKARGCGR